MDSQLAYSFIQFKLLRCACFSYSALTRRHKPQITLFECESMTNALMRLLFSAKTKQQQQQKEVYMCAINEPTTK